MTGPASQEAHRNLLVGPVALELQGFKLAHVTPSGFDPAMVAGMRAVLVAFTGLDEVLSICGKIRQHPSPAVYLAPILVLEAEGGTLPDRLIQAVDGTAGIGSYPGLYYQQFSDRLSAIHQRIARLTGAGGAQDVNLAIKFLRYLFTRAGGIRPVHDIAHPRGYHHPALDLFLGRPDDNVFDILNFLETQRLLTGEFVDRIHYCGGCGSAFLNFRETCPECHSAHLRMDDLVHHFRCAHVAPMEDFQGRGGLRCPKCEHELKQIGVDYDKPSSVYVCQDCGHTTQDPETATLCFRCGAKAVPEHLGQLEIKAYTLTGLGENAALHGLDNLFRSILESELDLLPLGVFKRFLALEIERTRRYRLSRSSLVMIFVRDLERIYLEAGPRAKEIFGEFGRILRAALRPSDVITAFNDSLFLVLATETQAEGARGMASRVAERLDELIRGNFTRSAEIATDHVELEAQSDPDEVMDRLIRQKLP